MIDISHPYKTNMQTHPSKRHCKYQIKKLSEIKDVGRETRKIIMGSHCGTHIDAPLHFIKNGKSVEKINHKIFFGKAEIIKFLNKRNNYEITINDLKTKIKYPRIKKLIFQFGWDKFFGKKKFYKDHPYLSKKACIWLVKRGYHLIGMDSPQIEDSRVNLGSCRDGQNHKILLSKNVLLVEYLANLSKVKKNKVTLVVAPLKLVGSDGSPARCFII